MRDSPSASRADARAALRVVTQRNFGPYFLGNFISMCGTWFQALAQAILIYRLTGSTFLVGVVNFSLFAGVFLMVPWSGSAADRYNRRRLLIATQGFMTVVTAVLAAIAATGRATAAIVIAFVFLLGLATAFAIPARQSFIPSLVERHDLQSAIALNSVTYNLARAVGPVLAAVIVQRYGIPWAFAANSVSYLALIAALVIVNPRPQELVDERPRLRETIEIVRRDTRLLALFGVVAAVAMSSDPVTTLTPAFATEIFGRPDTTAGVLVGSFGVGAVSAVFFVAGRTDVSYRRMGATLALLGSGILAFAFSSTLIMASVALFVAGFGSLASASSATGALQLETDDRQRGRVMALWSVGFIGLRPPAALLDGAIASGVGLRAAAVVMSIPALVAAGVLLARRRTAFVRALERWWVTDAGEGV